MLTAVNLGRTVSVFSALGRLIAFEALTEPHPRAGKSSMLTAVKSGKNQRRVSMLAGEGEHDP